MERARVFIIDGDNERSERLAGFLAGLGLEVKAAPSLAELLVQPEGEGDWPLALINLDPITEENVVELRRLKKTRPRVSLILLSGSASAEPGVSLLKHRMVDQISSPEHWGSIYCAVRNEFERRKLSEENAANVRHLKKLKLEQSKNQRKAAELEEMHNATLENLMTALDLRDVETFGHSLTVAKYCRVLAKLLGIKDHAALDNIRKGALLHDVGKIAIPDAILKKPSRLTASEWEKVKLHPVLGYGLIKEIKMVKEVGNIILYHHERYDGKGYPKGLRKDAIPLEARIFALADSLDAITSHRPYRKERDFKTARKGIQDNKGTQFDPRVVDAFCSVRLEEWERIRYETTKILPALETFSEIYNRT
jgi:putative nucleotidyltransferase with HDIG domain